ncbi:MAG: formate dehydrogenase subunit gamma [Thiolinea sp.]
MQKLLFGLLFLLLIPFTTPLHANSLDMMQQQDPGAELWNAVRGRGETDTGTIRSQVKGMDSEVLVNRGGDNWRFFRMDFLVPTAAMVLGITAVLIILFRLVRGKIKIKAGRSAYKIKRFSSFQRLVHWVTAILFVGLAITGMCLWFGRELLIPYLGPELGGDIMWLMKRIHDFSSPAFGLSLVILALTFLKGNFPHPRDLLWIVKGGGLLKWHAPAGRYNAGEKIWYWVAIVGGGFIVFSGAFLLFPNLIGVSRNAITYYHWIHGIAAIVLITGAMGHIYMGTIAMEGAFECMSTGYADANWAKEHHDVWYEEMREQGQIGVLEDEADTAQQQDAYRQSTA